MDEQQQLTQLRQTISEQFSKEELSLLCSNLDMKYENLPSSTIDGQAQDLVVWMKRRGRLPELITEINRRRPEIATGVRVYEHARYNLGANFTGRAMELAQLDAWLTDDSRPMFTVIALGGTGKSALTWHWLETVKAMDKQPFAVFVWHGFYETGRIDDFLSDVLEFLGEKPQEIGSKRLQLNRLMELLEATPTLLLLDGAERLLRAYGGMNAAYQADEEQTVRQARECVDPVAADLLIGLSQLHNGSKTLISSRLMPQELLGRGDKLPDRIDRLDLTGLDPADAYRFFTEWGIQATPAEVDAVCQPLDYHPFCMALLAGYAAADFAAPNDLRAAANYDPTADLLGRRQHILQRAYDNLPPTAQITLSRLAAFRAAVSWETIESALLTPPKQKWWQKLLGKNKPPQQTDLPPDKAALEETLRLLEQRGLLQRSVVPPSPLLPRSKQPVVAAPLLTFDLHPIARRYAYERLADRAAVHVQLIVYFEAAPKPQKINSIADLAPTIELYHHLTRAERYDDAVILFRDRLARPLYFQLGAYQQIIELLQALFPDGEDKLPHLSDEGDQAWTLNLLANSYSLAGRPLSAVPLFKQHNSIYEKQGNKKNTAVGLSNLATQQTQIGALAEAADNLRRRIALCQEIEDRFKEAIGHQEYGRLLSYCGNSEKPATELDTALELFTADRNVQGQGMVWAYRALSALLQGDGATAQQAAQEALHLADEDARTVYPMERDYVQAHWLLGWAALAQKEYMESQTRLDEALRRCRAVNLVELEPSILLAHARLARAQSVVGAGLVPAQHVGQPEFGRPQGSPLQGGVRRSHDYAQQALTIAERSSYVLNLADIHNHLALLALDANDPSAARTHAKKAHGYALCDGPPFAYQTALDEAERILQKC